MVNEDGFPVAAVIPLPNSLSKKIMTAIKGARFTEYDIRIARSGERGYDMEAHDLVVFVKPGIE